MSVHTTNVEETVRISSHIRDLSQAIRAAGNIKKAVKLPKPGQVFRDSVTGEWMLSPIKRGSDPVSINALCQAGGLPRMQGDKVTLWFFRTPPEGHVYWTKMHEPGEEIDYSRFAITKDFGRYFFRKQDAVSSASSWDLGMVVGLMEIPIERLLQNGQFKKYIALKARGHGDADGVDVSNGKYIFVKNR